MDRAGGFATPAGNGGCIRVVMPDGTRYAVADALAVCVSCSE
jgi:hypothetical protein